MAAACHDAALSYYVTFIAVVLYVYDRFLLPIAVLLCLAAARWLAHEVSRAASADSCVGAFLVALIWGLGRSLSVDAQMAGDSRYAAERWLRTHASGQSVGAIGPLEYLPRLEGLSVRTLGPSRARLERMRPDFVVLNADHSLRADPGSAKRRCTTG